MYVNIALIDCLQSKKNKNKTYILKMRNTNVMIKEYVLTLLQILLLTSKLYTAI